MIDSLEKIKESWRYLLVTWGSTRDSWQDNVADSFEQRFFSRWEREVPPMLDEMDQLEALLSKIKQEQNRL